jgi:hypothetical protein
MEVPKGLGVGGGCGVTDVVNTVAIAAVQAGPSGESA